MMEHFKKKILLLPGLLPILAVGIIYLSNLDVPQKVVTEKDIIIAVVASCIFVLMPLILRRYYPKLDIYILSSIDFLCSVSLIMLLRLKPSLYRVQFEWICLGIVCMCLTMYFSKYILQFLDYPYILGIGTMLLICLTLIFGTDIGGNRNWIVIGAVQVQPSEFAKILLLGFLTAYLQENKNILNLPSCNWKIVYLPPLRFLAPLITIWGLSLLMFVYQRDLGSALLFFGMAVMMTYAATSNRSYIILAVLFFLFSSVLTYFMFHHVRVRVDIWLHPWQDPMGKAYQIIQSLFALGNGGLFGAGYYHGSPYLIPAVYTDFIFSAIGEEFGLLGVLAIIGTYLLLFFRGMKIAIRNHHEKYKLFAFGLTATLLLQAFIILAGISKLLPLTGITLPFVSYGGSSMIASFISIGLLLIISTKEE